MIEATISYIGTFIDRPNIIRFTFAEDDIAMESKNETTGKFEKITVGQLYDIFSKKNEYIRDASDPEDRIDGSFFEEWFYQKHIADKHFRDKITNQTFRQI